MSVIFTRRLKKHLINNFLAKSGLPHVDSIHAAPVSCEKMGFGGRIQNDTGLKREDEGEKGEYESENHGKNRSEEKPRASSSDHNRSEGPSFAKRVTHRGGFASIFYRFCW